MGLEDRMCKQVDCVGKIGAEVKYSLNLFAIEVIFVTWCPSKRNMFGWTDLDFSTCHMFFLYRIYIFQIVQSSSLS